jgi:hypothetical protein
MSLSKYIQDKINLCALWYLQKQIMSITECTSARQKQILLFLFGIAILALGLEYDALAQGRNINFNALRLTQATNGLLLYLEGSFGALVMVASGIGAILSSAFGQYRAALGLMIIAIGSFILRSLMSTFFNDQGIQQ